MLYAEASYFDGDVRERIAAYEEHKRLERKRADARQAMERRSCARR